MANHVSSYIEFYNEDEALEPKLYEYIDSIIETQKKIAEEAQKDSEYRMGIFSEGVDSVMKWFGIEVPGEDDIDRDWFINNVGAKWCHLEDIGDSYISTTSAWSVPYEFVENLCKALSVKFPGTFAVVSYDDECYNFIGASLVNEDGVDEVEELDADEVWEQYTADTGFDVPEDGIWGDDEKVDAFYDWTSDWLSGARDRQYEWYRDYIKEVAEEQELLDKENLSGC